MHNTLIKDKKVCVRFSSINIKGSPDKLSVALYFLSVVMWYHLLFILCKAQ